ncbi:MAG: T9SS type A sorting domain-containing protein [candidate division WOR-3 bacterium]
MNTYQMSTLIYLAFVLPTIGFAQTERWVYRYSGVNGYQIDEAVCLVYGNDGNIYAGGYTWNNDSTNEDFTVISLTDSGSERWVYKYLTLVRWDGCSSICYGADGNIYAAGSCTDGDSLYHFTIISLTADGIERWIYQYPDASVVSQVCYGEDGNIYAIGSTQGKILVVSVDTNGAERWSYTYPTASGGDGRSIVYGQDGNIYIVGRTGPSWYTDVTVISLTPSGEERWVYFYNGPGDCDDYGECIIYGADDNLYIVGSTCYWWGPGYVFFQGLAISLTPSGMERWTYISPADPSCFWWGVYGTDGNLYAAGDYGWDIPFFLVESISDSGTYRWQYIDTTFGYASSIACGNDGNIYVAGKTSDNWQGGESYFTVISFAPLGSQQWIYRKVWSRYLGNQATSIVYGSDGNIYAGGLTTDSLTGGDFTVISLSSTGIEENKRLKVEGERLKLEVLPSVVKDNAQIQFTVPERQRIIMNLYDIIGRKVKMIAEGTVEPGVYSYRLDSSDLNSGVYFFILQGERESKTKKLLIVR